jgi:hypothetical protein
MRRILVALTILVSVGCASKSNAPSTTNTTSRPTTATTTTAAPTTAAPTTAAPTTAAPTTAAPTTVAAPKTVFTVSGSSDKTTTNFTVGGTWQLGWVVHAATTPSVEIDDESGSTIDHLDTGQSGGGSTIEHQACTCYLKVSVFGSTTYSFTVTDLPGGAPTVAAPVTFTGSSDKTTTSFTVSSPWTLSWSVHAATTPTVEVDDESGNTIDHVDTGQSGSGSTIEHQACTCYLKISVFGTTTYSFTATSGG